MMREEKEKQKAIFQLLCSENENLKTTLWNKLIFPSLLGVSLLFLVALVGVWIVLTLIGYVPATQATDGLVLGNCTLISSDKLSFLVTNLKFKNNENGMNGSWENAPIYLNNTYPIYKGQPTTCWMSTGNSTDLLVEKWIEPLISDFQMQFLFGAGLYLVVGVILCSLVFGCIIVHRKLDYHYRSLNLSRQSILLSRLLNKNDPASDQYDSDEDDNNESTNKNHKEDEVEGNDFELTDWNLVACHTIFWIGYLFSLTVNTISSNWARYNIKKFIMEEDMKVKFDWNGNGVPEAIKSNIENYISLFPLKKMEEEQWNLLVREFSQSDAPSTEDFNPFASKSKKENEKEGLVDYSASDASGAIVGDHLNHSQSEKALDSKNLTTPSHSYHRMVAALDKMRDNFELSSSDLMMSSPHLYKYLLDRDFELPDLNNEEAMSNSDVEKVLAVFDFTQTESIFGKLYSMCLFTITLLVYLIFVIFMIGIDIYILYMIVGLEPANAVYFLYPVAILPLAFAILPLFFVFGMIVTTLKKLSNGEQICYVLTDRRFIAYFQDDQIYGRTRSPSYEISSIENPPCLYYSDVLLNVPSDKVEETIETLKSWNMNFEFPNV